MESPDDPALAAQLDAFLEALHQGNLAECAALRARHPELECWIPCLEALDQLATPTGADRSSAGTSSPADPARSATVTATPTGERFGDYLVLEEIGRGGMGVVFRARQVGLERDVALKMVLASRLATPRAVERFTAEARAAARLRHPHIVSVFDAGQIHGQHYYAMPLVVGSDLARLLTRGPLDPERAMRLMTAVARAVDYLHKQGIVHRDLKPSNILLDESGQPLVTDFGLAKLLDEGPDLTQSGVVVGTAAYMAPEQARGRAAGSGPAADIYSLGAILFELLTGRPPFESASPLDILVQLLGNPPPQPRQLNPRVSKALERVVLHCLEKHPEDRYASAAELAEDLERCLRGEPPTVRPPGLGDRLLSWMRREPALAGRVLAGGVFYLVQLANRYLVYRQDPEFAQFHRSVTILTVCWLAASVLCQLLVRRPRWQLYGPLAWTLIDSAALGSMLCLANGPASPLVIVLPLLIVASGLWFRGRIVAVVTAATVAIYLMLVVYFRVYSPAVLERYPLGYDHHAMFVLCLVATGMITAFLATRIRWLARRFDSEAPH